uniref:Ig-like domain-containing protein n=1 Tax=Oryzias sinensis TaxID=183150 RepID=A0A8C7WTG2_9TELE
MLLYLFLLLSHILGEFKNRDSSFLEAAASTHHLIHLMASFSPIFPGLTTADSYPYLYWYKHDSDLQAPQFILWKGAKSSTSEHIPDKRYLSRTTETSTELIIRELTLADTALYYCAVVTQ